MDKNDDDFKFPKDDYSWLIGLAFIAGLFAPEEDLKKEREKYEQSNERSRTKPKS